MTTRDFTAWREQAAALDAADPLAPVRTRFTLPDGVIYLDGNSLGAMPVDTPPRLAAVMQDEWGTGLIRSWNSADWIGAPARVGAKIARLIGARPHEVVVADSTSVNLYKLIVAALTAQQAEAPERTVILSEPGNFPTDLYMIESAIATLGHRHRLELRPREEILARLEGDASREIALVLLTHVHYKTADVHDMAAITSAAHAAGALTLWDLSHSAGALPLDLHGCNVDLAVGCGYKFLNGGPGAPAYLFVAERHQARLTSPLGGWMGHARPFEFVDTYEPGAGMSRFLCGTPAVLALLALEVGVDLHLTVDMQQVAAKSRALAELFIDAALSTCGAYGVTLVGPPRGAPRGSHVSFSHAEGYAIMQALIARGVIGDFRAPDIMRFGLTPLYLRYGDVMRAVDVLHDVLRDEAWRDAAFQRRNAVT